MKKYITVSNYTFKLLNILALAIIAMLINLKFIFFTESFITKLLFLQLDVAYIAFKI